LNRLGYALVVLPSIDRYDKERSHCWEVEMDNTPKQLKADQVEEGSNS